MAHYAFLDENNTVVRVIVGIDETDTSHDWEQFYGQNEGKVCKRTSYNTQGNVNVLGGTPFRKNYAGIGFTYDEQRDAFIPPRPCPSWTLNEETCVWVPPIPYPSDGKIYKWDANILNWVEITN